MNKENYFKLSGAIFVVIALLHAARIFYGWDAMIYGWSVPAWLSWVVLVVAGYLGYQGIRFGRK